MAALCLSYALNRSCFPFLECFAVWFSPSRPTAVLSGIQFDTLKALLHCLFQVCTVCYRYSGLRSDRYCTCWPTWFLSGWWCCQRGLRVHLHLRCLCAPEDHWQCRKVINYRWQTERPFHPQTKATRGWRDTRGTDCCEQKRKKEETSVRNIAHNYSRVALYGFFKNIQVITCGI